MKHLWGRLFALASVAVVSVEPSAQRVGGGAPTQEKTSESASIYKLDLKNVIIQRVSAQYITDAIDRADREGARLVLLTLHTPGGALDATRDVIEKMLNCKTPVAVYVAPSGARAASAGFLITIAADVAAMAPGTNTGAASPVTGSGEDLGETMAKKVESDAAAYARTLASKRGRNVEEAEKAVVDAKSWTEDEALASHLIDYVFADEAELLKKLDGTKVKKFDGRELTLALAGASVVSVEMTFAQRILSVVAHPNVAYVLMALGMLGLYFELSTPGAVLPGVVGAICLILAFFALQVLPVNYAGLLLLIVGVGLLIAEVFAAGFGALGIGGGLSVLFGSLILFDYGDFEAPALAISRWLIALVTGVLVTAFLLIARLVIKSQRRKPASGEEGLIGELGTAKGEGKVFVHGEYWNARSKDKLESGERVRVVGVDGLVLTVERVGETS